LSSVFFRFFIFLGIVIYDIPGRRVLTLVDTDQPARYHKAVWDSKSHQGIDVSSSVYFYRIEANEFVDVKKMVLLR
jgi:flagellar hook assembly protein FlgD